MENLSTKENVGRLAERNEKPKILYHSSVDASVEEFAPREGRVRDPGEGPRVFATPDKALASIFLIAGQDDSWVQCGYLNGVPVAVICMDREEFLKRDKGGAIYELPSDSFSFDPNLGLRDKEWTSPVTVKPVGKTEYPSALDVMTEHGVQVYFVDRPTFEAIEEADNFGIDILSGIQSENERRGLDIRSFETDSQA